MRVAPSDGARAPVILIIGGGGGIGSCVARRMHRAGATLALAGRDRGKIDPLARELEAEAFELDATSFEAVEQCLEALKARAGCVDGVLNCAGSILLKPAHLTTSDELQEVLAQNLITAFSTVRAAASVMRQSGGSIVLMTSAAAEIGLANHEAIAAAKAGIVGLTRSAAATYAAQGIRVNAVAPGLVDTPMSARLLANQTGREASIALHPLGRIGTPEDVAEPICWLLSTGSGWVTGQVIGVDGGLATLKTRPHRPRG